MKKALSVLAVASLAAVVCVPFAACGENADNFKSQEVDKETFAAAFSKQNFKNVLFEGTLVTEAGEGNEYGKSTAKIKFVIDGSKEYMKKGYYYEEDGESVLIKFKDGKLYSLKTVEKPGRGATLETSYVFTYGGQSMKFPL